MNQQKTVTGQDILMELLQTLNKTFGGKSSKDQIDIYYNMLKKLNVPFEDIATGFQMAMLLLKITGELCTGGT